MWKEEFESRWSASPATFESSVHCRRKKKCEKCVLICLFVTPGMDRKPVQRVHLLLLDDSCNRTNLWTLNRRKWESAVVNVERVHRSVDQWPGLFWNHNRKGISIEGFMRKPNLKRSKETKLILNNFLVFAGTLKNNLIIHEHKKSWITAKIWSFLSNIHQRSEEIIILPLNNHFSQTKNTNLKSSLCKWIF